MSERNATDGLQRRQKPPRYDRGMTDSDDTRGERRERKRDKKRRAMRMHGASLRRIYKAAVRKRARRARKRSRAEPDAPDAPAD